MLDWGIEIVLWFQRFSPLLDGPFKLFSFLGEKEFFMLFLPLVYWCVDRDAGCRLMVLFLLSAYLNAALKVILQQPRPFDYDPRVRQLVRADAGGLPSGHTQGAVVVWGFIAAQWRRPWVWAVAGLLMIGIPLSRVYLGVHFPTDLLGGYLIGALLLGLYFWLAPVMIGWLRASGFWPPLIIAVVVPLSLVAVYPGGDGNDLVIAGSLMGMGVGFTLERGFVRFRPAGRWWLRICAYLVGVTVLFGIYYGLRVMFSGLEPAALWRFTRYALVGIWGALGAPWVFVKLKLAQSEG